MKLDRVYLQNFRQYAGAQHMSFSREPQRNVTVVHGVNGAGKTSLFLAINWCLYGEGLNTPAEAISKGAASQVQPGERVNTVVEVTFTHDGERYLARREAVAIKQVDGSVIVPKPPEFTMVRTRGTGVADPVRNPVGTMNVVLPGNVRTYFLFDGEKIDNFAKPEAAGEVKFAVHNVLKLEVLIRAHRRLAETAADYRRELKQVSTGELRTLVEREEQLRSERAGHEERRRRLEAEVASARQKVRDIDQRLAEKQEARMLQQRREILQRDLQAHKDERDHLTAELRDLASSGYLVLAAPAVEAATALLDSKRERRELPSDVRQQFVQDLLDEGRCICGRTFDAHGPEHQHLVALLHRSLATAVQDDALATAAALGTYAERAERQRADIARAMKRRAELTDAIGGIEVELDEVSALLKGSPQEDISGLERQRSGFQGDIDHALLEQGVCTNKIDELTEKIAKVEREIERAKKDETREAQLTARMTLAQHSADAIEQMYQTFADDMRQRIEAQTKKTFQQLIWKDTQFQDVTLNPEYQLQVIDRWGQPARQDLSAGERQVLSLSFITAMGQVSEEEAPLVIDTPFGRLSSAHRDAVTLHLPDLTHQLVLFITDEELRDQALTNLVDRIGAEYRLEFNQADGSTEIVEVV